MAGERVEHRGLLLGNNTPVPEKYAPQILCAIPRASGRETLGLTAPLPFYGADRWHAYEVSWLDATGKPEVRVGCITVPADTPNIVESKSLKLYLNSLNSHVFGSEEDARLVIAQDVSALVGAAVSLALYRVDNTQLAGASLAGTCLDKLSVKPREGPPHMTMLPEGSSPEAEEQLYSHLLRSLCPVTGQPDWATIWVHYRGSAIDHAALLQYFLSYREHQEFHEQCVERIFRDIHTRYAPQLLSVQGFYTRRGGLDINPFRSTDPTALPLPRLNRQ